MVRRWKKSYNQDLVTPVVIGEFPIQIVNTRFDKTCTNAEELKGYS